MEPAARRRSWTPGRVTMACGLAALCLLAFAPTLRHGFVWDDHEQVVDNPRLRSWTSFPEFWRQDVLTVARADAGRSNYWRPLFYAQYLLYFQLFGPRPAAWHALALLHHLLASGAVVLFLRELGFARRTAFLAAALFLVHPAHTESVAWIAAAFNDPPMSALLLLAATAHLRWRRRGAAAWLGLAALAYAAALCVKEAALAGLPLLLLVEAYDGRLDGERAPTGAAREASRRRIAAAVAYVVVTALYLLARRSVLGTALGVYPQAVDPATLAATIPLLLLWYARLLLWPWGLSPSYPVRYLEGWSEPLAWAALGALVALAAGVAWLARRRPVVAFGALWCLACVLPALNVLSFRPTYLVHHRYLYLAALGLCLPLAWALAERARPRRGAVAAAGLLAAWTGCTLLQTRYWSDDAALWRRVAAVDPNNPAAFDWLGARALAAGRDDEAESLFRRAIAADAASPFAYCNLATLYQRRGRVAEALPYYEAAASRFRAEVPSHGERRVTCEMDHAVALARLGRVAEALAILRRQAEAPPYPAAAARNAAVLLGQAGRWAEAAELLAGAVARHPDDGGLAAMLADAKRAAALAAPAPEAPRR